MTEGDAVTTVSTESTPYTRLADGRPADDDPEGLLATIERSLATLDQRLRKEYVDRLDAEEEALLTSVVLALDEVFARFDRSNATTPVLLERRAQAWEHFEGLRGQTLELVRVRATLPAPAAAERPKKARVSRGRGLSLLGSALTVLGILALSFVLFQFWVTDLTAQRSQRNLVGAFEQRLLEASAEAAGADENTTAAAFDEFEGATQEEAEVQDAKDDKIRETIPPGTPIMLVQIPEIGLDSIGVEGTGSTDLKLGPGHLRNSPMPGEPGNAVIAGRRTTYGEPFRNIDRLDEGDEITVVTSAGIFDYEVVEQMYVSPGDPDVLGPTQRNLLTLVTAHPEYQASERLVVQAELIGEPVEPQGGFEAADKNRPAISPDEEGLSRDPAAWAPVFLWGELLLIVIIGTFVLYRRWLRWPTWLVTTPVLVAVSFLWFESLNRLLPSTL